jgi:PKD repeat protein
VSHTYPDIGVYTATVTAANSVSAETATSVVTITDAPVAGLSTVNDSPTPLGHPTTLAATVTGGSNVAYAWSFGDGNTGTGDAVSHTYPAIGTYTAVVTASNSVSAITDSSTVSINFAAYLPCVINRWPPLPYQPSLHPISNPDSGASYTVSWTEQPYRLADEYTLHEAANNAFTSNVRQVCRTTSQACEVTGRLAGTYYYRVRGHNTWGDGPCSGIQSVTVLPPATPTIQPIANDDGDADYTVAWSATARATWYQLLEDTDPGFTSPQTVHEGAPHSWNATGKTPDTYYYRVRALGPTGQSEWSESRQITIYPLFVGLELRWDGEGYIRGSDYYNVGAHIERDCNGLTDQDMIRCHGNLWYDPNPRGFDSESWDDYYSISTGYLKSSSVPDDPAWKWGMPWILPYDWELRDGDTFHIRGQRFRVTGPHSGYTAFGRAVRYWKLVNRDRFVYWDGGGDWKAHVRSGDATLHYDAGNSRLLLRRDIVRTAYYKGDRTGETVHYILNLTSANAFPGQTTNTALSQPRGEAVRTTRGLSFGPQPAPLQAPSRTTTQAPAQRPPMGLHERATEPRAAPRR